MPYLRPYRKLLLGMVIMGLYGSAMDAVIPLFQQYAINHFVGGSTLTGLGLFIGLYALVVITQVISNYISAFGACKAELYIGRDLKRASFNHLQTLSFSYFNRNSVGYVHARVMSDTDRIASTLAWGLMEGVWYIAYLLGAVVLMLVRIGAWPVGSWAGAGDGPGLRLFPEKAGVLPPAGPGAELADHRRLQRGHHRGQNHQNPGHRGSGGGGI